MTTPDERTRALIRTYELLNRLLDPSETPRVPKWLREEALVLLRHYPTYSNIELAHKALPNSFGPVPPLSQRSVQSVIDAPGEEMNDDRSCPETSGRESAKGPQAAAAPRETALASLPHIAVCLVRDDAALLHRVEDLALDVGDMVTELRVAGAADWWRHQDLLDDLLDIRDYIAGREG